MWKVTIAEHHVPPRWDVSARTVEVAAPTAQTACVIAVRWAHIDADIPPLRSMLAVSMAHATAEPARSTTARSETAA
jgi:hypothetical protein